MSKAFNCKQKIRAIILAGSCDFGKSELTSRLPTALWPVLGKSVLERLLISLAKQGVTQAIICSGGNSLFLEQAIQYDEHLELTFLDESLPVGTAGCIRDAVKSETNELLLIFSASIISPPKIDFLLSAHKSGQSDLTVVLNPDYQDGESPGEPAGIYICESSILQYIPKEGYFDIKESLIPEMLRAGKTIHTATLPNHAGNFRDRQDYLYAIARYIENAERLDNDLILYKRTESQTIWMSTNVNIDSSVRIYGPVAIMDGACVCKNTVILGPAIVGRNVYIDEDSIVTNSVLWDNAHVGSNCEVKQCIIDYNAVVQRSTSIQDKSVLFKPHGLMEKVDKRVFEIAKSNAGILKQKLQSQLIKIDKRLPTKIQRNKKRIIPWLGVGFVLTVFIWSYWPNLVDVWKIWRRSDEHSSGILVPFLAVYILWSRRRVITQCPISPSIWGLFGFILAQAVRFFGLFFLYNSAERLSIVLSIAALVLLLFGWKLFRKVFTVLLFLFLMLPWPNRVQAAVTLPLQRWATSSAVFCLEMIGYEIVQEGNIIHIGDSSVAVAEACNGLRMITAFFVIGGLVVLLVKRAFWEKLIVLISSLPVALICNTIRLAVTAMAFTVVSGEYWEKVFHDFGGYVMMPLALLIVVVELWLMAKLTTPPIEKKAVVIERQKR